MSNDKSIYEMNGYRNRRAYLKATADVYDVDYETVVLPLADLLGLDEDFDGLISMVEDASFS